MEVNVFKNPTTLVVGVSETINYNINKNYNYLKNNERKEYYQVSNMLKITVEDLNKVREVIDVSSNSGANNINNINFELKDDSKYYNEALKLTMKNAKEKAISIMGIFGKIPKEPKIIFEITSNIGVYRKSLQINMMMDSISTQESVQTPIQSNNISIQAKVRVIYEY